jgi:hypothetical protein
VFKIDGELLVNDDLEHEEMLSKLYALLKANDWFFVGETKQVKTD